MTDWPLLSVVTFIPLICVLFLLPVKDATEIGRRNIRQVAPVTGSFNGSRGALLAMDVTVTVVQNKKVPI